MTFGSDTDAINMARDAGVAAFNAGDIDQFIDVWLADDAILMLPNEPSLVGKAAIRDQIQDMFDQYHVHQTLTSEELVIAGEWAFNRISVRETITPKTGGKPFRTENRGIDIYRRQADGSWKAARSITNSSESSITLVTQWLTHR